LDLWLSGKLRDLSRSSVQSLVKSSRVTVEGKVVKPSHRLKAGERVVVVVPPPEPLRVVPEAIPLDIVFEDKYLLVINKPAGVVVHPGAGNPRGTIVNALVHYCRELASVGETTRPGIVHRLDKGTSGILISAKDALTHQKLSEQLSKRLVKKIYLSIVWGRPSREAWSVEAPIGRDGVHRQKMAVVPTRGRESESRFRVIAELGFCTFLEATPRTGRTHQIRVHLAHSGHPIVGDAQYGGRRKRVRALPVRQREKAEKLLRVMDRPALHAARVEFDHPRTGERLKIACPVPDDFLRAFDVLGYEY